MRIAAIGDIHCNHTSHDLIRPLFGQIARSADILLLCGDLVDYGLPDEATVLAKEIANLKIPVLAVLGNHEYESGEPAEIFPFLGSSRLEEPLNRYPVSAVFHGHAHRGAPEGRTKNDVPVYNVAMKLLQSTLPDHAPFRIIEMPED